MTGKNTPNNIECFDCAGTGKLGAAFHPVILTCFRCKGEGVCPEEMLSWGKQGRALRKERRANRISMPNQAKILGISLRELSDYENGMIDPANYPKNEN